MVNNVCVHASRRRLPESCAALSVVETMKWTTGKMTQSGHYEQQYLDLMRQIWTEGAVQHDRTGVGTKALFGAQMRFSLAEDAIPLLTTKRVFWKTAAREMLWFLTGNTNIRPLLANKVRIWTDWPLDKYRRETGDAITQDAFEARIIEDEDFAQRWGDLGPVYGAQWVNWPRYEAAGQGLYSRADEGFNQISALVESLQNNPGSRRHIIEGWNVAEIDQMALPPCHKTYQFQVANGKLNGLLFQRSCDLGLGFAFNVFSASLLIRMLAQQTGYEAGELIWQGGDVHLYLNHAELVEEQLSRTPSGAPKLAIVRKPNSIFDYTIEDFVVSDYAPQAHISAPVAV
jgi:thymidylate synthase